MANVYPTTNGNWSTRVWNDDATGAAYGPGTPQVGDTVLANGRTITVDVDITLIALSTRVGVTATAGGVFATSGQRTVTADTYGGTTSCLTLTANSQSVHIGNSYGSDTTASAVGTTINATCQQFGNATGGNGASRFGSSVGAGGRLVGNTYGGTVNATAYGAQVSGGGIHLGNSHGGTHGYGTNLALGAIQIGDSFGGSGPSAHGTVHAAGTIQIGNATGGTVSGAYGTATTTGSYLVNCIATGTTAGAFGVSGGAGATVVIISEVGAYPKTLNALCRTDYDWVPFLEPSSGGSSTFSPFASRAFSGGSRS